MTTDYYNLGYDFGKLCCQFQPAPLQPPVDLLTITQEQFEFGSSLHDFWTGYDKGWEAEEASPVTFVKLEV